MHRSTKALVSLVHVAVPFIERGFANLPDDAMQLIKMWKVSLLCNFRFSINVRILDIGDRAGQVELRVAIHIHVSPQDSLTYTVWNSGIGTIKSGHNIHTWESVGQSEMLYVEMGRCTCTYPMWYSGI